MTSTNFTKKLLFIGLFALLLSGGTYAQKRAAVKTNALYWGTLSPNVGGEIVLPGNYTIEITTGFNPFSFSNDRQWRHWMFTAEFRYWLFEPFNAHFFGVHYLGALYNVGGFSLPFSTFDGLNDRRALGNAHGVGISYGYNWIIGNNLALEAMIGGGFVRFNYDTYPLGSNGERISSERGRNFFGPTRIGVSLVRVF